MRVLLISAFLPALGTHAGAARSFNVARGISRCHDLDVLSFVDSDRENEHVPALEEFCRSVTTHLRRRSPSAGDLLGMQPRHIVTEYGDPGMRSLVADQIDTGMYDLVQFEYLQSAYLAPSQSRVPLVFTHHEVQHSGYSLRLRHESSPLRRASMLLDWMRMLHFELDVCARFDRVITVTEEDRDSLLHYGPQLPVTVNHTGVDCSYYAPQPVPENPLQVVFVGYYRHSPNVDAVLHFYKDVLPLIWREEPGVRFVVVGGGLLPEVEALGQDPRVTVTGWVQDYRPYVASSITVVPVRLGRGIRHKVLEAWAMGRPVVSTSLGVAGTGAQEGITARIGDTPPAMAAAVLDLVRDAPQRRQLGEAGRQRALTHFDWTVTLAQHEGIYRELASSRGRESVK